MTMLLTFLSLFSSHLALFLCISFWTYYHLILILARNSFLLPLDFSFQDEAGVREGKPGADFLTLCRQGLSCQGLRLVACNHHHHHHHHDNDHHKHNGDDDDQHDNDHHDYDDEDDNA